MTGGVLAILMLAAAAESVQALPPSVCPGAELARCRFTENHPLGKDRHGDSVALVAFEGPDRSGAEAGCPPATYGLLHSRRQRVVSFEPLELLDESCAGDGSVFVAGPNRIVHQQRSESNWVYVTTRTWAALPELRLIETSWLELYKGTGSSQLTTVGKHTKVSWTMPDCSPAGELPDVRSPGPIEYRYTVIPVAADPGAFRPSWMSARFPGEALVITSAGGDGYVVSGRPGAPSDAQMRVLALSARELVIEIDDDRIVAGNPSWVKEDHLELWVGDTLPRYSDLCVHRSAEALLPDAVGTPVGRAWQWGIRASDGAVFAAAGHDDRPGMPSVERATIARNGRNAVIRFRIALPAAFGSVTIVYSDTDDGRRQKRLIGTSKVVFGDPLSLGQISGVGQGE